MVGLSVSFPDALLRADGQQVVCNFVARGQLRSMGADPAVLNLLDENGIFTLTIFHDPVRTPD